MMWRSCLMISLVIKFKDGPNLKFCSMNASHSPMAAYFSNLGKPMLCILGIYGCFLTWGVLQERISTIPYPIGTDALLLDHTSFFPPLTYFSSLYNYMFIQIHRFLLMFIKVDTTETTLWSDKFSSFIFLNLCQAIASWIVSSSVVYYYRRSFAISKNSSQSIDKNSSLLISTIHSHPVAPAMDSRFPSLDKKLFWLYLKIAIIYSTSSPFAYASLKYIHYVAMNLGKACKLLPLVLIKIFVKRESIERGKLFNLLLITTGVVGFLLFETPKDGKPPSSTTIVSSTLAYQTPLFNFDLLLIPFGIVLLLTNLFLDGLMSSMQDEVFSTYKLSPFHMMFYLNGTSIGIMTTYLLLAPWSTELMDALKFIAIRPSILPNIILFSICGALGQGIIFITLGNFGAIFLVTISVTRKLFTILLSVLYFGHALTSEQWASVFIIFAALILEAYLSASRTPPPPPPIEIAPSNSFTHAYRIIGPKNGNKIK